VLVNTYGILHFSPIQVKSVGDKKFTGYSIGSCAQILDLPAISNTRFIYTYNTRGDLDTNYLVNDSNYIKYTSEYEVLNKVYPITNILLPTNLKVDDILLSCPGIHPPLSKEITETRLR
jgi:hypothetical protein